MREPSEKAANWSKRGLAPHDPDNEARQNRNICSEIPREETKQRERKNVQARPSAQLVRRDAKHERHCNDSNADPRSPHERAA